MRFFEILRVIAKYRLHDFLPDWLSFIYSLLFFWQPRADNNISQDTALRKGMEDLGPVFIKLGQMLSVRRDLLPDGMADELSKLQDAVPPDSWVKIQNVINDSFGAEFFKLFNKIDKEPIASASIAQVHLAVDSDDKPCVIKVVRPNIKRKIKQDIRLARLLVKMIDKTSVNAKRMRLPEVIDDYDKVIHDELDLLREAASMSQLKRNFAGSGKLYVPEPDWDRSSERVLTMERISGIPIGQVDELKARKVNMQKLGELGVEIFFTQVFRDNFFHADMHPGNIFVNTDDPDNPSYVAVDFGIMGSLDEQDAMFVAQGFLAFFNNDYNELAKIYIESGWVQSDVSHTELQAAFRTVLEPVSNRPIEDISLGKVLLKLFRVSKRFRMQIQPQLVLLDKTLLYIEGVGKQLYPELDLWQTAKPFLEEWLKEHYSIKSFIRRSSKELPKFLGDLPEAPGNIQRAIAKIASDPFTGSERKIIETLNQNHKKTSRNILVGSGFVSASILFVFGNYLVSTLILALSFGFWWLKAND